MCFKEENIVREYNPLGIQLNFDESKRLSWVAWEDIKEKSNYYAW